MNDNTHNIIENVTEKIKAGKVSMYPRARFVFCACGLVVLSVVTFLASVAIVNFILFSLHLNSTNELLGFGPRGWSAFFRFFPWGLLAVDIVGIVLLVSLLRTFRFGYRTPLLYVLGALILCVVFLGFALERHTPMNVLLDREMRGPHMPYQIGGVWNRMHMPPPSGEGLCRCEVVTIEDREHFTARDVFSGETYRVVVRSDTSYATTTGLIVGDRVYLAGEVEDGTFTAFGLKKGGEGRRWGMDR